MKPVLRPLALPRRSFLSALSLTAAGLFVPGVLAEELQRTAKVEEGPFYPTHLPLDTDNDLLIVNDSLTPATGEITHLTGRLLDAKGDPLRNVIVEIWQADHNGVYLAGHGPQSGGYDPNFQGFGRFFTGSTGEYYFRTIKPVAYTGRPAPHIHFAIKQKGRDKWTTQLFIKGDPGNARDNIYNRVPDAAKKSVSADFAPLKASRAGELSARFDIILGTTPEA